jgi:hypothetical protein
MERCGDKNSGSYKTFRCEQATKKGVHFAICLEHNTEAWNRVAAQRKEQKQREYAPWETS